MHFGSVWKMFLIPEKIGTPAAQTLTFERFNKYEANKLFSCELFTKRNWSYPQFIATISLLLKYQFSNSWLGKKYLATTNEVHVLHSWTYFENCCTASNWEAAGFTSLQWKNKLFMKNSFNYFNKKNIGIKLQEQIAEIYWGIVSTVKEGMV